MKIVNGRTTTFWMENQCQSLALAIAVLVLSTFSGCGGVEEAKLSDYLEELEFNTPSESLKEVQLGSYVVSSAILRQEDTQGDSQRTWVKIKFQLYVVVEPSGEEAVLAAYQRHQGMFDDMVVQVFRSASIDELSDPSWAAIKSRLSDLARPILRGERIRQIVINDFGWDWT